MDKSTSGYMAYPSIYRVLVVLASTRNFVSGAVGAGAAAAHGERESPAGERLTRLLRGEGFAARVSPNTDFTAPFSLFQGEPKGKSASLGDPLRSDLKGEIKGKQQKSSSERGQFDNPSTVEWGHDGQRGQVRIAMAQKEVGEAEPDEVEVARRWQGMTLKSMKRGLTERARSFCASPIRVPLLGTSPHLHVGFLGAGAGGRQGTGAACQAGR